MEFEINDKTDLRQWLIYDLDCKKSFYDELIKDSSCASLPEWAVSLKLKIEQNIETSYFELWSAKDASLDEFINYYNKK